MQFAIAAMLLVACGTGDSAEKVSEPTTSAAAVPGPEAAVTTTVAPAQGGFGAQGAGTASAVLGPVVNDVVSAPRLFRRDSRDVFVAMTTSRTVGTKTTAELHVYGFNTTEENEAKYPLATFGDRGVVKVTFAERDDSVLPVPVGFSVFSERTAVVLFRGTGGVVGVLEYHDLTSGGLDARYGDAGRVVLTREATGMTRVADVSMRTTNDAGLAKVVVLGHTLDDAGVVTDVRLMGVGANGQPDSEFGDKGTVSWMNVDGKRVEAAAALTQMADPGDDPQRTRVAAVGLRQVDDGAEVVTMVSRAPAADSANGAVGFADPVVLQEGFAHGPAIRLKAPALVSPTYNPLDNEVGVAVAGAGNEVVLTRRVGWGREALRVQDESVNEDFGKFGDRVRHVVPMPDTRGKWLAAAVVVEGGKGDNVLKVCFEQKKCNYPTVFSTKVLDAEPSRPAQVALRADEGGVAALVSPLGGTGDGATVVGFDAGGTAGAPVAVEGRFWSQTMSPTGYLDASLTGPYLAGRDAVVAVGADYLAHPGIDTVRVAGAGAEPVDVAVTASLQNVRYSAAAGEFAPLDGESAVAVGHVWDEDDAGAYVERITLHKVSLRNGSTLTPFGTGDRAEVVTAPLDGGCARNIALRSDAGGVAVLVQHHVVKKARKGELAECEWDRVHALSYGFVNADGAWGTGEGALPRVVWNADEVATWGEMISAHVDAAGSLFTLWRATAAVPSQPWLDAPVVTVRKWTPTGEVDAGFGDDGAVTVAGAGWNPAMTVDAESRAYVAWLEDGTDHVLHVTRLRADGTVDAADGDGAQTGDGDTASIDTASINTETATLAYERRLVDAEMRAEVAAKNAATEEVGPQSQVATPAVSVFGSKPVVIRVSSPADNSLLVEWASPSTVKGEYVVATAVPNGRGCAEVGNSCLIRGLSALQAYRIVLSGQKDEVPPAEASTYPAVKPSRVLKTGRKVSLRSLVQPGAFVPAADQKWTVTGDCAVSPNGKEFETPDEPGLCTLTVTTPKVGDSPKTSRTVTVRVIRS